MLLVPESGKTYNKVLLYLIVIKNRVGSIYINPKMKTTITCATLITITTSSFY